MLSTVLFAVAAAVVSATATHAYHAVGRNRRGRTAAAEQEESESVARALIEHSPRGIHLYKLTPDGRLVFSGYSPSADEILGVDHSPFLGKTIEEAFPDLAKTEVPERYRAAAKDGTPWRTEQITYDEGQVKGAFEVIAFGTKKNSMAAVFSDITAMKRAETELKSQQAFAKTLIESLPGIFYLYDYPDLNLIFWNRNHETELGFTAEEVRGRHITEWHIPEAKEGVRAAVEQVMNEGPQQIVAPLMAKDGRRIPYLLSGTKFVDGKGNAYLMGVGIDITDRIEAEKQLRILNAELEDRVKERTAELSDALRDLKNSQKSMMIKDKLAALGQLVAGLAHELNTPLGAILSAVESGSTAVGGLSETLPFHRGLNAEEERAFACLISNTAKEIPAPEGRDDRLRRKKYRTALEKSGIEHSGLLAEKLIDVGYSGDEEELSSLVGLERFPRILDAAFGLSTIIKSNYVIKVASERAAQVVFALKTYTRQEQTGFLAEADVRVQIETVLTILRNRIKHGVAIEKRIGAVPAVKCYPDRLNQVWMNLINNAVQAMNYAGKLTIEVRSEYADPDEEGRPEAVAVAIEDDGPGIPREIQDRIFEPFFTTKAAGEGTGLGLDICRRILGEIGASVTFESRPGHTKFTVRIPIVLNEEQK